MKKFTMLLLAAVGLALFVSCGPEIPKPPVIPKPPEDTTLSSLEGTVWKGRIEYNDFWSEDEMAFSESEVTYILKTSDGYERNLKFSYSYNPPEVEVESFARGRVKDGVLLYLERPVTLDVFLIYELELQ